MILLDLFLERLTIVGNGILDKKIENIEVSETEILVTDYPGSVMQINCGLMRQKRAVNVMHRTELIENHMDVVE